MFKEGDILSANKDLNLDYNKPSFPKGYKFQLLKNPDLIQKEFLVKPIEDPFDIRIYKFVEQTPDLHFALFQKAERPKLTLKDLLMETQ